MKKDKTIENAINLGINNLIGNMIILAFEDLYHGDDYNKASAKRFFKSRLFKATGLSFEYLDRKYREGAFKKNITIYTECD